MDKSIVHALLASLALASYAPLAAHAQGGTAAPGTPPAGEEEMPPLEVDMSQFQMPPGPDPLSKKWDAEAMSPETVAKGEAALAAVAKAHKAAGAMTDDIKIKTRHPLGEQEETISFAFGPGEDFSVKGGQMILTSVDKSIFLELANNNRKYLRLPVKENAAATIREVLPGPLPFPLIDLRTGQAKEPLVQNFDLGGLLSDIKVVGFRTVDGKDQVLLKGANGDLEVTIDPTTKLIGNMASVFSPPGAPPGMTVLIDAAFNPTLTETLATPITAPESGGRKAVESISDLMTPVSVGEPALSFSLPDNTGRTVNLADLKGNVVVLDFWATWCAPCQVALPKLNDFAKWVAENGKPVKVFGVDVWERVEKSERAALGTKFWETKAFAFPTLIDADDSLIGGYGFQGIPVTVVIGLDGNIAAIHQGHDPEMLETLKKDVEKALAAAPTGG